jgi:hypothetical protein
MALAHYPEWIHRKSRPKSMVEHRMMPALRRDQPEHTPKCHLSDLQRAL